MSVFVADTCLREGTDDAARHSASGRTGGRGNEPARRDDGTDAWNGEKAETGEQTRGAADSRADAGTFSRTFCPVIDAIGIAIDAFRAAVARVPVVGIVRDKTDVAVWYSGRFRSRTACEARSSLL